MQRSTHMSLIFLKIFFGCNKKVSNKPQKSAGWPQKL